MPETKTEIQNIVAGTASAGAIDIRRLVYVIRGTQVMLDSDLSGLQDSKFADCATFALLRINKSFLCFVHFEEWIYPRN